MREYLIINAKIWTADRTSERADCIWVKDGKIHFVGNRGDLTEHVEDTIEQIDVKGCFIMPSFVDCHVHITTVARSNWQFIMDKDSFSTFDELLAEIGSYSQEHPIEEVPYIYATPCPERWMANADKSMLDKYVSDRPVLLCDEGFHSCLVNSKMLELMEIDENTPYDETSSMNYARDEKNRPTGIVYEHRYEWDLPKMYEKIGWYPPNQSQKEVIGPVIKKFNDYGITAILDGFTEGEETFEGLKKLEEEGNLHMYYRGNSLFKKLDVLDQAISSANQWNHCYSDYYMQTNHVKLFLDGTNELGTSALMEPFINNPDNYGLINMEEEELTKVLLKLNEVGYNIQIHMVGDRAFHVAVNAVEKAKEILKDRGREFKIRVTFLHCELTKQEDRKRAAEAGIAINITPHWNGGIFGDAALSIVGQQRFDTFYSFNDFIRYGMDVSCSSDIVSLEEIERANPFVAMKIGATRRDPLSCFEERQPAEEKLTLRDMMYGFTIQGAKDMGMDEVIGSLEIGKRANFCLLNKNPFEIPIEKLDSTKVITLVFEGKVIKGQL